MNKKVLITGGARGLGSSLVRKYAGVGYDVVFTYFNSALEAQNLKEEIESTYKVKVDIIHINLESEEEIESLFSHLDRLDVLINNAAYNDDKYLLEKTSLDFEKALKVNLIAPFLTSKYAYPLLKSSKGSIVNIASTNGIDTMYTESADYDASKAGLINLTKNISCAFAPEVRVNAVAPGWIMTHKLEDADPKFIKSEEEKILLKRFANPSEITNVVYFLTSDEASYMTGEIVRVDGGCTYGN
jgi:3-oxoacyl-[acyl-carrier protein] reductase